MALTVHDLKRTHQEVALKIAGLSDTATITLASLASSIQELDGLVQAANIVGVTWTGATDAIIKIVRDSVTVMTLQANAGGSLEFTGQQMYPDNTKNTKDIVVTTTGQGELWIKLRKMSGYKTADGAGI